MSLGIASFRLAAFRWGAFSLVTFRWDRFAGATFRWDKNVSEGRFAGITIMNLTTHAGVHTQSSSLAY